MDSRLWKSIALVAFCGAVTAAAGPARSDEVSNESCLACHAEEGMTSPSGRPLFVDGTAFAASVHAPLPCTSCHPDAATVPHETAPRSPGVQACSACHGEIVATYQQSIHGRARANGATDAATCSSCHGAPHAVRKATDPAAPVYPLNLPRTCGACHGDAALAKRHGIPIGDAYQLYMDSIHGRALTRTGLLVAANCSSCHGSHGIRPKRDPASKVYRANIPSTCGACHVGVEQEYFQGSHGRALRAGNAVAPVCIDCHSAHQIRRVDTSAWQLGVVSECGSCHAESLKTYRDTFHGQVTALGFTSVARCSDCHGAHRVLPPSDPSSSVAPANLVATCRKCHPQANVNFVHFAPHADPWNRQRNPALYYTILGMNVLIIGVFAFFGLHTVLWLLRSLLERRRALQEHGGDDAPSAKE